MPLENTNKGENVLKVLNENEKLEHVNAHLKLLQKLNKQIRDGETTESNLKDRRYLRRKVARIAGFLNESDAEMVMDQLHAIPDDDPVNKVLVQVDAPVITRRAVEEVRAEARKKAPPRYTSMHGLVTPHVSKTKNTVYYTANAFKIDCLTCSSDTLNLVGTPTEHGFRILTKIDNETHAIDLDIHALRAMLAKAEAIKHDKERDNGQH
jgi:hypothetical protein